jgi:hypothetical protein
MVVGSGADDTVRRAVVTFVTVTVPGTSTFGKPPMSYWGANDDTHGLPTVMPLMRGTYMAGSYDSVKGTEKSVAKVEVVVLDTDDAYP